MTTINLQVNASADDAYQNDVDDVSITVGSQIVDDPAKYFGHRWSVPIPQGATINWADFIPYLSNANTDEPAVETWSEGIDDAAAFVAGTGNENISLRTPSAATHVEVESLDLGVSSGFFNMSTAITNGATYGALVQAVVNRAGWVSGNHLVFITRQKAGFSGARDFGINMYDLSTAQAAKLDIDYTGGGIPPVERSLGSIAGFGTAVAAARHAIHSRIVASATLGCSSEEQSNVLVQRLVAELIRASDPRSRRSDASRAIAEFVGADDVTHFRTQLFRALVDALGCNDDATVTAGLIRRLVADEFGTSDDSMLAVEWRRRFAELLTAADEADRAADAFRRLLDDLGIADGPALRRVRGNIWPGDTTVAPLGPQTVRTAGIGPGQTQIQGKLLDD